MDLNEDSNGRRGMSGPSHSASTAVDRFRRAVTAATAGAGSRGELQEAARGLVTELRRRNEAPEQMLIQMKNLLGDAGLRAGYPAAETGESYTADAALYRDIISWAIRCYYEDGKNGEKSPA
jgi:hypothetical protein